MFRAAKIKLKVVKNVTINLNMINKYIKNLIFVKIKLKVVKKVIKIKLKVANKYRTC